VVREGLEEQILNWDLKDRRKRCENLGKGHSKQDSEHQALTNLSSSQKEKRPRGWGRGNYVEEWKI
jgi:hypothetical protein